MVRLPPLLPLVAVAVAACTPPAARPPSLSPRAAETIDPRVPVVNPIVAQPVNPGLARRLAALVAQARAGDAAFRAALGDAQRLAALAGGPQSDGWVAAQEALSAAIAARGPTTRALADIDSLAAEALAAKGTLGTGEFEALQAAAAQVAAIDRRQAQSIDSVQARLRG